MNLESEELYQIIKGLKHRKPKLLKGLSEKELYKKYYIAACRLRIKSDDRYESYNPKLVEQRLQGFEHKKLEIVEDYMNNDQEFTVYLYKA